MLNFIWLGLILLAVILGGLSGSLDQVTIAAFDACKMSVMSLALPIIGLMAIWLGMMRLAEKSGLIHLLAKALRPIMIRLFPEVPPEHPAMGAMLLNMGANMLGLSNAATPLGLKAMSHLEKLNRHPGTASNAMCTFLAINTSSIQLVPATTVAYLAAAGSLQPTWIIGPAFLASVCTTTVGVCAVKLLGRLPMYRRQIAAADTALETALPSEEAEVSDDATIAPLPGLQPWARLIVILFFGLFALFAIDLVIQAWPVNFHSGLPAAVSKMLQTIVNAMSILAVPFLLAFFPLFAALKKIPVYEEFVEGAKEGFQVAIRIIPFLVAILASIGMVRAAFAASAKFDWFVHLTNGISKAFAAVGFPAELFPLVLLRPLSGSGTSGVFNELIRNPALGGPDGLLARTAGCIMGSTETTFYVIAVYFGSVGVRRTRHAIPAGLLADAAGVIASIVICRLLWT